MKEKKKNPTNLAKDELMRSIEGLSKLDIGSEEYLTGAKSVNQNAETYNKSKFDWSALIPLGATGIACGFYLLYSETHIVQDLVSMLRFAKGVNKI